MGITQSSIFNARPIIDEQHALIQRAVAGDPSAREQLFKEHAEKLYRMAFRVLRNKEDSEDALQDSWVRACTNLVSFEGRSSISTWLTRIVINSALMILRKKRGVREVSMEATEGTDKPWSIHEFPDESPNPEQCFAQSERTEILHQAIRGLRPRIRAVIQFGELRELSLHETARCLGISAGAAKARLFHARAALRKSVVLRAVAGARNGRVEKVFPEAPRQCGSGHTENKAKMVHGKGSPHATG